MSEQHIPIKKKRLHFGIIMVTINIM